jgi:hypothetical protein
MTMKIMNDGWMEHIRVDGEIQAQIEQEFQREPEPLLQRDPPMNAGCEPQTTQVMRDRNEETKDVPNIEPFDLDDSLSLESESEEEVDFYQKRSGDEMSQ